MLRRLSPLAKCAAASEFAALWQAFYPISCSAGNRLNCERRIGATNCRKDRSVADSEISHVPAPAIGVDDTQSRVVAHAGNPVQVAGIIRLFPDMMHIGGFQCVAHEIQGVMNKALIVVTIGIGDAGDGQAKDVLLRRSVRTHRK